MDRWTGILKVPLYGNRGNIYKVAASLCVSSSPRILEVPHANAIFFHGDRVEGTENPVIERLSDPEKIVELLVSKFGGRINAWVVEASTFNGPFAVYKDFIPSVNEVGEPQSYEVNGFPASSSIVFLLGNCLKQAKFAILGKGKEPCKAEVPASRSSSPKTILLGFSKGGTVLNQMITELGSAPVQSADVPAHGNRNTMSGGLPIEEDDLIMPRSNENFLNSIVEIHYVDVGLNAAGAYLTNQDVIDKISNRLKQGASGIRFVFHGTPRQWCDSRRLWIKKEKDQLFRLLKGAARANMGKLHLGERFYFSDRPPSMQMHFEIIEHLNVKREISS